MFLTEHFPHQRGWPGRWEHLCLMGGEAESGFWEVEVVVCESRAPGLPEMELFTATGVCIQTSLMVWILCALKYLSELSAKERPWWESHSVNGASVTNGWYVNMVFMDSESSWEKQPLGVRSKQIGRQISRRNKQYCSSPSHLPIPHFWPVPGLSTPGQTALGFISSLHSVQTCWLQCLPLLSCS